jgi:hypothetical protein
VKKPTFLEHRKALLAGLKFKGWDVHEWGPQGPLKVPYATSPSGDTRLWFKTQSIYMNEIGQDPRDFAGSHSLSSDIREIPDADRLELGVARMRVIQRKHDSGLGLG